jgi:hypothetical protein
MSWLGDDKALLKCSVLSLWSTVLAFSVPFMVSQDRRT